MNLTIHRGTNQIGGNLIEVATGSTKIILDCGTNLPPLDGAPAPDTLQLEGLTYGPSAYDAVFITHYHADHCGLLERINADIPVYAGLETKQVLDVIADFIDAPLPRISQILEPGVPVRVGDMQVLPISARHSARGAMMFLIRAEGKQLLYTGDFNGVDEAYISLLGNVDALLCEGTNISLPGGHTEESVEQEAAQLMRETGNHVFVLASTTNIDRIRAMERACKKSGRTIAGDPFFYAITNRLARLLSINPVGFMPYYMDEKNSPRKFKYIAEEFGMFAGAEAVAKINNLVLPVRPTMGKFMARLNKHRPLAGAKLIYSMWDGYKSTEPVKGFLSLCESLGMEIVDLHASGHAYRDGIERLIGRLSPGMLIPVHTESAEAFGELHHSVCLPKDGERIEI